MAESNGVTNPNVNGGSGKKAPPFDMTKPAPAQTAYNGADIAGSTVEGGRFPNLDANKANPVRAKEIGAGSIGNANKPFRLNGGG